MTDDCLRPTHLRRRGVPKGTRPLDRLAVEFDVLRLSRRGVATRGGRAVGSRFVNDDPNAVYRICRTRRRVLGVIDVQLPGGSGRVKTGRAGLGGADRGALVAIGCGALALTLSPSPCGDPAPTWACGHNTNVGVPWVVEARRRIPGGAANMPAHCPAG